MPAVLESWLAGSAAAIDRNSTQSRTGGAGWQVLLRTWQRPEVDSHCGCLRQHVVCYACVHLQHMASLRCHATQAHQGMCTSCPIQAASSSFLQLALTCVTAAVVCTIAASSGLCLAKICARALATPGLSARASSERHLISALRGEGISRWCVMQGHVCMGFAGIGC